MPANTYKIAEARAQFSKLLNRAKAGEEIVITHVPTRWLDDKHSIFGEFAESEDQVVVDAIAQGDSIESVSIARWAAPDSRR